MLEAGGKVVVGDVLDERGCETARALGDAALYLHLDVTSENDWHAAVATALDRFGKLDILVNNAGLFLGKDIEAASLAEWQRLQRLPIGRMGTPNDIAKGIVFLASDDAAFMTGSAMVVDVGITAQ